MNNVATALHPRLVGCNTSDVGVIPVRGDTPPLILANSTAKDKSGCLKDGALLGAYADYVCRFFRPIEGRRIIVANVDVCVSESELWRLIYTYGPIDVLAWEYEDGLTMLNLDARLFVIPAMLMDKQAVQQGDIRYNLLCTVSATRRTGKGGFCEVALTDFVMPNQNQCEIEVTHFSQWVDYWSVDFDWNGETHNVCAYAYRPKKGQDLPLKLSTCGIREGAACRIQVVDLFANETFLTLR